MRFKLKLAQNVWYYFGVTCNALGLVVLLSAPALGQVTITGTFKNPDTTNVGGKVQISLARTAVQNKCTTPVSIVRFPSATVRITAGTLGTLSLYATPCLTPSDPYIVKVFNAQNVLLYTGKWTVPNKASANVTELDSKD